jgi:sodium transport system permease protein
MIGTIFKKELTETLRDRKTLMMMIIVPTLIFPIIMNVFSGVSSAFRKEAAEKNVNIGIVSPAGNRVETALRQTPKALGRKQFVNVSDSLRLKELIQSDSLQLGIVIPANAGGLLESRKSVPVTLVYNATEIGMKERADAYLDYVTEQFRKERYAELKVDEEALTPIRMAYSNVASGKEMIGKLAGGFLPYIIILFSFLGCMYPAIDLFTGEKERGTIETLLTTPVSRWKLLTGKMSVVVLSGLMAATFSLIGLFLSIEVFHIIKDEEFLKIIHEILTPGFFVMLYLLLIPLVTFFAGIMVPIAVRAKTFKEAQSVISPLNILIILPAMVGFFPGIELNAVTSMLPVVNVVLATKELIAGTLEWQFILLAFVVMTLLAAAMVMLSYRKFGSETNVVN